jgi:hypothetical protein
MSVAPAHKEFVSGSWQATELRAMDITLQITGQVFATHEARMYRTEFLAQIIGNFCVDENIFHLIKTPRSKCFIDDPAALRSLSFYDTNFHCNISGL